MYYYYNALQTKSGDVLPDYLVRLFTSPGGDAVDIFADDSGTPIATASGVTNAAKADSLGMVRFWVPNGTYDIAQYDTTDTFKGKETGVPLFDAGALTADLSAETGATLVGTDGGDNVQEVLDAANSAIALRPTSATLAASGGADLVGFSHAVTYADDTLGQRLKQEIWVTDAPYNADPTGVADSAAAIQAAIDAAEANGVSTVRLNGLFRTEDTLVVPSGVSLEGQGARYRYDGANIFEGTWIKYRGTATDPAIRYGSVQSCRLSRLGIDCNEVADTRAISIGSDNDPAAKDLTFTNLLIFGAEDAVQWGDANAAAATEQCDEISFRDCVTHSCINGFTINAANAADFSVIERVSFNQLSGVAFKLLTPGFMRISQCAAGLLLSTSKMFEISGVSPDPLIIEGCQSEGPDGKFLTYSATNDEGLVILRGNVLNQPVEITGITRVQSVGNYCNSTIALSGYARLSSECDVWNGAAEVPQVTVTGGARFRGVTQRDAAAQNGRWIPVGLKWDRDPTAGGYEYNLCVRAGIMGFTFVPTAEYGAGSYVLPTVDNGYAYICTVGGITSTEPTWPTTVGNTVTTGAVTFECVGEGALVKGASEIAA